MQTDESLETEINCLSSGDHCKVLTLCECPCDLQTNSKVGSSKIQISPISLPIAKYLPLLEILTQKNFSSKFISPIGSF